MLDEALVGGAVGWLVAAVGTTLSRRGADAALGTAEERSLYEALVGSTAAVVDQVPAEAREDVAAALRERSSVPSLGRVEGDGPREILANLVDDLVAPLALPGQTLAVHNIDPVWLAEALLDALLAAIRRAAVVSGALADLAQLIGIENLEHAQQRLERLLAGGSPGVAVNNLPRTVLHFVGRDPAQNRIRDEATRARAQSSTAVIAVEGMAGIGKTELAVHVARALVDEYPDSQLYIDLQGFSPGMTPTPPARALESLLLASGVPSAQIPTSVDQRITMWRSRLHRTRTILVLDNARDADQVTPLLPSGDGCLVLVTSRRSMANIEDSIVISLDVLDEADAVTLFSRITGHTAATAGVRDVAVLCGFLPLAIRLAAGRLRRRPHLGVSGLVDELALTRNRLGSFRGGNRDVRVVFDLSYRTLDAELRDAFRRLGLHPGPDISIDAAAALFDADEAIAARHLEELLGHSLLHEAVASRFVLHDLIREYAHERVLAEEDAGQRLAAERRLMLLYRTRTIAVNQELSAASEADPAPAGGVWARRWLESERMNIVETAKLAVERVDPIAVDLARSVGSHLLNLGFMDDAEALFQAASTIGQITTDREAQALGLLGLGEVGRFRGEYTTARTHLAAARDQATAANNRRIAADALYHLGEVERVAGNFSVARGHHEASRRTCEELGDVRGQANALRGLAEVAEALGDLNQARDSYAESHTLCVSVGHRQGQAFALFGLGEVERSAGNFATAMVYYQVARTLCRDAGDRRGQANAAYGMGELERSNGDHAQARLHFEEAYAISVELGNRRGQAYILLGLGNTALAAGDPAAAEPHFESARAVYVEIGEPSGEARAIVGLGEVAALAADPTTAADRWRTARSILDRLGLQREVAEVDQRLAGLAGGEL